MAGVAADEISEVELAAQRLAKIFGAMQPKDAASVLNLLDRADVELIVRSMSNRRAAQILSKLDAELVAELSRIIMHSSGGGA